MRLLLINPNTSTFMTERMLETARPVLHPETRLTGITAPRGVPYIASRAEAQIAGAVVLEMLAEHADKADAAVIAAFGDPGLIAARELFDIPVVGLAEAAMLTACMVGPRFGIVTFSPTLRAWYSDCVALNGLSGRCAGIWTLPEPPSGTLESIRENLEARLLALALRAIQEEEADVLIFSGAPLAGLAAQLGARIPVPVVDQVIAAVRQAETLAALNLRPPTSGSLCRPVPKESTGLPEALAARIAHRGENP